MPKIKPFCALKPAHHLVSHVVTRPLEYYGTGEARLIASENSSSFLHLISPELENHYLRGSRQELIYKKVNENFDSFLEQDILIAEKKPAIYIYRVKGHGLRQTGIWTLTDISDYLDNHIKKHEVTVERREAALADYLQQTGLDANPVLITYFPESEIQQIIQRYTEVKPDVDFIFSDGSQHQIWTITDTGDIKKLSDCFSRIKTVYIADGHHRVASIARMHLNKKKQNLATSTFFSSVYMDTREVKVFEYNRIVKDLGTHTPESFLNALKDNFIVNKKNCAFLPGQMHHFAMFLDNEWFELKSKENILRQTDPVSLLDVSILQDYILNPILNITDPRTDARLSFMGGRTDLSIIEKLLTNHLHAVTFILFPTSVQQIIDVAEAGETMPPKSTYVEPKFLVGLLTNLIG